MVENQWKMVEDVGKMLGQQQNPLCVQCGSLTNWRIECINLPKVWYFCRSPTWLVVSTPLKNMSSSVGMMTFPSQMAKTCSKAPSSIYVYDMYPFLAKLKYNSSLENFASGDEMKIFHHHQKTGCSGIPSSRAAIHDL